MNHWARILSLLLVTSLLLGCATSDDWARVRAKNEQIAANEAALRNGLEAQKARHEHSLRHPSTRNLNEALALSEEEFDLSLALWLFAKEYHDKTIDVEAGLERIDNWRHELAGYVNLSRSEEDRLETLRTYIHVDLGFAFDDNDPNGYRSENLFIDTVSTRRRGYCVTLSMIYLLLAPSAGLEAHGTFIPGHFAVLVKVDGAQRLVETTANGSQRSIESVEIKHRMSKDSRDKYHVYLAPLADRELLSALYNNLGALKLIERAGARGQERATLLRDAELFLRRALELSPTNSDASLNLAMALSEGGSSTQVRQALALVNDVLTWDVNSYNGLVSRASILDRFGDQMLAKADLRRAKGIMPTRPDAWIIEGNMATRENRLADAKAAYEKALGLDEFNFRALNNLAVVEERLGNVKRAEELAERARAAVEK